MNDLSTVTGASRRTVITTGLGAGSALVLGVSFTLPANKAMAAGAGGVVNAYIEIHPDETVTIVGPNSEMGQGTSSALPQIVAEELMIDWSKVRMRLAGADVVYANPLFRAQFTGGSTAIRGYHNALRLVGAAAREMLITAAAARFGVAPGVCVAENGAVRVLATGEVATYGELAAAAALITPPANPPLTPRDKFRIIGKPVRRLDIPAKTNGKARFGIDVRLPNMLYAGVKLAPKVGQTLGTHGTPPRGMTAVPFANGVAVVTSTTTWQAMRAARSLPVTWVDAPFTAANDTSLMKVRAADLMANGSPVRIAKNVGDAAAAIDGAPRRFTATYEVPYVAHATMEPMNATALVTADRVEIWAPTQAQGLCAVTASRVTGIPVSQITVNTTFLGGGLGRKFEQDYIEQAVLAAKANPGKPVKLTWTREDDFTHDQYRPRALSRFEAGLDAAGTIVGWSNRIVSPSIGYQRGAARFANPAVVDSSAVEGANTFSYAIPNQRVEWILDTSEVPVGYWRSVGHSHNAFFVECFIDELANAAGADPIAYRRRMLAGNPRAVAVLDLLAAKSGWATPAPPGRYRGVALTESFGSIVGEVAEISGSLASGIRVRKVTAVIDCGNAINPDIIKAQVEGAIVHGLTAALWSDMPFVAGQPMRRNFNTHRMLRLKDMPEIATYILESGGPLGGVGEPGVPPVAPAVVNAIARSNGTRVRSLPIFPQAVPTA